MKAEISKMIERLMSVIASLEALGPDEVIGMVGDLIANPPKVKLTIPIKVSSAVAEFMLTFNKGNRNMTERVVQSLSRTMLAGRFEHTHQGVALVSNGTSMYVVDGQKRFESVRRTGVTVTMDLTFIPVSSKKYARAFDGGEKRRASVNLKEDNAAARMAAMKIIARLCAGNRIVCVDNADEFDVWNAIFRRDLDWAISLFTPNKALRVAQIVGAMAFAHAGNTEEMEKFGHQVATGVGLSDGAPALLLRNKLLVARKDTGGRAGGNNPIPLALLVLNAALAFVGKRNIRGLTDSEVGLQHFQEAVVTPRVSKLIATWNSPEKKS